VDLYGNPHTHNPLPPLVPDLDRHVSGIALRQAIPSNLCRALSSRTFGSIQVVELKTVVITGEAVSLPHVKVEPWHRNLSLNPVPSNSVGGGVFAIKVLPSETDISCSIHGLTQFAVICTERPEMALSGPKPNFCGRRVSGPSHGQA
jgi:hypothetical protein